ncbi:MAG: hypothetical protein ACFB03_01560, partial [Paracoccaceae bacterium]
RAARAAAADSLATRLDGLDSTEPGQPAVLEACAALADAPLWHDGIPDELAEMWADLKAHLENVPEEGWDVWTTWYEDRLAGDRPVNKALELKRILIPAAEWRQGPAHVNGIIRRLIEEYKPKPSAPEQKPTPVRFEFREGAVRKAQPDNPQTPEKRRSGAEQSHKAIAELLDRALSTNSARNNPTVAWTLEKCRASLGGDFESLEVAALGVFAAQLDELAKRADDFLMGEAAASVVASNAQLQFLLRQLPQWADYVKGVDEPFGTPQQENAAVRAVKAAIEEVVAAEPGLVAPDANRELEDYATAAVSEERADGPTEPSTLATRSYLRVAGDFLAKYTGALLGWVWSPVE